MAVRDPNAIAYYDSKTGIGTTVSGQKVSIYIPPRQEQTKQFVEQTKSTGGSVVVKNPETGVTEGYYVSDINAYQQKQQPTQQQPAPESPFKTAVTNTPTGFKQEATQPKPTPTKEYLMREDSQRTEGTGITSSMLPSQKPPPMLLGEGSMSTEYSQNLREKSTGKLPSEYARESYRSITPWGAGNYEAGLSQEHPLTQIMFGSAEFIVTLPASIMESPTTAPVMALQAAGYAAQYGVPKLLETATKPIQEYPFIYGTQAALGTGLVIAGGYAAAKGWRVLESPTAEKPSFGLSLAEEKATEPIQYAMNSKLLYKNLDEGIQTKGTVTVKTEGVERVINVDALTKPHEEMRYTTNLMGKETMASKMDLETKFNIQSEIVSQKIPEKGLIKSEADTMRTQSMTGQTNLLGEPSAPSTATRSMGLEKPLSDFTGIDIARTAERGESPFNIADVTGAKGNIIIQQKQFKGGMYEGWTFRETLSRGESIETSAAKSAYKPLSLEQQILNLRQKTEIQGTETSPGTVQEIKDFDVVEQAIRTALKPTEQKVAVEPKLSMKTGRVSETPVTDQVVYPIGRRMPMETQYYAYPPAERPENVAGFGSESMTNMEMKSGDIASAESLSIGLSSISSLGYVSEQKQSPITGQDLITIPASETIQSQRIDTIQILRTPQMEITDIYTPNIPVPYSPTLLYPAESIVPRIPRKLPPPIIPLLPPLWFGLGSMGKTTKSSIKAFYMPSLTGIFSGMTIKGKPPVIGGFETRYPIRRKI